MADLTGKTILVTRAINQSGELIQLLHHQGASVLELPTLEIGSPSSWEPLDRAIAQLGDFNWLILTSANGVNAFFNRLAINPQPLNYLKIAVVGEKTAQSLMSHGQLPHFTPPDYIADALVTHFPEPPLGQCILFPRVESGGREVLVKELTARGALVTEVAAYQSHCAKHLPAPILASLEGGLVDVITFASSKTVTCFQQIMGRDRLSQINASIASIGPQTSATCREVFGRIDIEAREYTLEGLTAALCVWARNQ